MILSPGPLASATPHRLVRDAFLDVARDRPTAPAVSAYDASLTYGVLALRSSALAAELRRRGAGREAVVAVCLNRSAGLVTALLGTMLSGAAFLPLDPSHPTERLRSVVRDARAGIVLADPANAARFDSVDVLSLDEPAWRALEGAPAPSELPVAAASDLAYVIYTSGSTGAPKGVEVQHDTLANLVAWHRRAFQITPADRATQLAGPGFDAIVWELLPYLAVGASVAVAPDDARLDPRRLHDWLLEAGATVAFVPTALAAQLVAQAWPESTPLRLLLTGADALHTYPRPNLPFVFVNAYGPTEATVVTTAGVVPFAPDAQRPPTIGRPIDNVHVHVVDETGVDTAAGEPGELWVGGANVARGYRGRADLTAERFVPDPFGCGGRIYRTGDLVRWSGDEIEFLGRLDDQVKIRGNRVEPQEVAMAVARVAAADAVYVRSWPDASGELRLVAYLATPDEPDGAALRTRLEQALPSYMIPSAFVRLDALPLNSSGKVDRSALPEPPRPAADRPAERAGTGSQTEQEIAAIVAELLDVPGVDPEDDFFQLGGHSLLGAQLVARTEDLFDIELPLWTVFEHPTIAGLAIEVDNAILAKIALEEGSDAEVAGDQEGGDGQAGGQERGGAAQRPEAAPAGTAEAA